MNDLNQLENHLDQMFASKEVKKTSTFVAKYKGRTIVTRSGKSSWKAVNHAKAAIILSFDKLEHKYIWALGYLSRAVIEERRNQFRQKLWQLISIEELK